MILHGIPTETMALAKQIILLVNAIPLGKGALVVIYTDML